MTLKNQCPMCGQMEPPRDPNRPREQEIWILQRSEHSLPHQFVRAWLGKPTIEQLGSLEIMGEDDLKELHKHGSMYADRGAIMYTLELQS